MIWRNEFLGTLTEITWKQGNAQQAVAQSHVYITVHVSCICVFVVFNLLVFI